MDVDVKVELGGYCFFCLIELLVMTWLCIKFAVLQTIEIMVKIFVAENMMQWRHSQYSSICEQLPPVFRNKAEKFLQWRDKQAFLLGKLLLKKGLEEYGLRGELIAELQYDINNRPYLKGGIIEFNISHSGGYVLCAMSSVCRIGIDIEMIHEIDVKDFASCFTTQELDLLNRSPDKLRDFFKIWTIKEATIKADGRGLEIPLDKIAVREIVVIDDRQWNVYALDIAQGYVSHLAADRKLDQSRDIQMNLIHY